MWGVRGVSLVVALVAAGPLAAQDVRLPPEETRKLLSDTTFHGHSANGGKFATYNAADGSRLLLWQSGAKAGSDRGTWRMDGEQWCTSFQNLRGGAEACFVFVKRGDTLLTVNVADRSEIPFTVDQSDTTGKM